MISRAELQEPARCVEADRPEAPRADAQGLRRREDVGAVGGPEQPAEDDWLVQGTDAYRRVVREVAALGGFTRVTVVRTAWDTPACAECGEWTKFWVQGVTTTRTTMNVTTTHYLCSLACLRVWAIKERLTRDVPKT